MLIELHWFRLKLVVSVGSLERIIAVDFSM